MARHKKPKPVCTPGNQPEVLSRVILPGLTIGLVCAVWLAVFAMLTLIGAVLTATPIPALFAMGAILGLIAYKL